MIGTGRALARDLPIRVAAVIVAVILWIQAFNSQNPMITAELEAVPVDLVGLGADLSLVDATPEAVTVTVSGRRDAVDRLARQDVRAWINLHGLEADGPIRVVVQTAVPPALEVVDIKPRTGYVVLDRVAQRQVPVELVVTGKTAPGYVLGEVRLRPAGVIVEGPESKVLMVRSAQTILDVADATTDIERMLPVRLVGESGETMTGIQAMPHLIEVFAPVIRLPPAADVPVRAVVKGEPAPDHVLTAVDVVPSTVRIRGVAERVETVEWVAVEVDISGATTDFDATLAPMLPEGIAVCEPRVVRVIVRIEKEERQLVMSVPVRVVNVGQGLRAMVVTPAVSVTVIGPGSRLQQLPTAGIIVEVNARGLGVGEYELPAAAILPEVLEGKVEPSLIRVAIVPENS